MNYLKLLTIFWAFQVFKLTLWKRIVQSALVWFFFSKTVCTRCASLGLWFSFGTVVSITIYIHFPGWVMASSLDYRTTTPHVLDFTSISSEGRIWPLRNPLSQFLLSPRGTLIVAVSETAWAVALDHLKEVALLLYWIKPLLHVFSHSFNSQGLQPVTGGLRVLLDWLLIAETVLVSQPPLSFQRQSLTITSATGLLYSNARLSLLFPLKITSVNSMVYFTDSFSPGVIIYTENNV